MEWGNENVRTEERKNSRFSFSLLKQFNHSWRDNCSSLSVSQYNCLPNKRAQRFGLITCEPEYHQHMRRLWKWCIFTFRTKRRNSLNSIFCNRSSWLVSNVVNFQSKMVCSLFVGVLGCWRLYSLLSTLNRLVLNSRWSGRRHSRRFDWLLCIGDRRMFVLLIFGQTGFPLVDVVFGIGLPCPSEHQQPTPPIHWTAAYVPSERHRGTNFFGDAEGWAIAYARDFKHSVYE